LNQYPRGATDISSTASHAGSSILSVRSIDGEATSSFAMAAASNPRPTRTKEHTMPRFVPRLFAFALLTLVALLSLSGVAAAQNRFALVIGNSSYRAVTPLPNPVRDAQAVTAFLRTAGFEVTSALNLDQSDMRRVVRDFAARHADKDKDTVALIYFAGHGVQVDGENYLLPVDADIAREADVALEGVRFADIMNHLDRIRSATRIVILDACRNNPFADGNAARGLAIVNAPAGSLVAYSTSPGATAEDGSGANSPFAAALLESAKTPGAPIEATLKNVRLAVHKVTDGRQIPWEVSSLVEPFSFFPGAAAGKVEPAREKSAEAWRKELQSASPEQAVEIVLREDRVVVYREFVTLFPQSPLLAHLRSIMERRLEMWDWFEAVSLDQGAGYEAFLKRYPNSDLAVSARRLTERALLRSAMASASPGELGISAQAAAPQVRTVIKEVRVPSPPEIRTVVKEVRVPSPPEIRTVVKEVPVVKTVVKEVPVVKTVTKVVRVPSPPVVRTVTKVVRVPTPCRCTQPGGRGPSINIGPPSRNPTHRRGRVR
jgi:hypothetical protein